MSGSVWKKDRTIQQAGAVNKHLRGEVDRLLRLALPAPRRRALWPFGRRKALGLR